MSVMEQVGEVCIGTVDAIPEGEGRSFLVAGRRLAVFRQRDGRLFATQQECPHRGAPLADGVVGGGAVVCPYHSQKFDLSTGECVSGDSCSLRTYPVREERGLIVVTV